MESTISAMLKFHENSGDVSYRAVTRSQYRATTLCEERANATLDELRRTDCEGDKKELKKLKKNVIQSHSYKNIDCNDEFKPVSEEAIRKYNLCEEKSSPSSLRADTYNAQGKGRNGPAPLSSPSSLRADTSTYPLARTHSRSPIRADTSNYPLARTHSRSPIRADTESLHGDDHKLDPLLQNSNRPAERRLSPRPAPTPRPPRPPSTPRPPTPTSPQPTRQISAPLSDRWKNSLGKLRLQKPQSPPTSHCTIIG